MIVLLGRTFGRFYDSSTAVMGVGLQLMAPFGIVHAICIRRDARRIVDGGPPTP
ncbi:hypothetical protein [Salinisphaera sp. T31B1]|uniref:hypothetical protein n=1 Tax=Salinisphaera sp. T31B1 TaxID=727963 RepID=UPI00333FA40B